MNIFDWLGQQTIIVCDNGEIHRHIEFETSTAGTCYPVTERIYLWEAAPDLLAVCENEVTRLANLASMVSPQLTNQLMEVVYAAIAKARGEADNE